MTDEELCALLRMSQWDVRQKAADRIEALVNALRLVQTDGLHIKHARRAERLEAALREIESIDVHSGGEIHGVTALQWELAFDHAQDVARTALKGDDHV